MTDIHSFSPARAPHRLKELLEDLRLNHEYCPREVILQAADVIEHLVKEQALAQRQWVGLTDEEVENLCLSLGAEPIEVRFIEAKLKGKTHDRV